MQLPTSFTALGAALLLACTSTAAHSIDVKDDSLSLKPSILIYTNHQSCLYTNSKPVKSWPVNCKL